MKEKYLIMMREKSVTDFLKPLEEGKHRYRIISSHLVDEKRVYLLTDIEHYFPPVWVIKEKKLRTEFVINFSPTEAQMIHLENKNYSLMKTDYGLFDFDDEEFAKFLLKYF